MLSDYTTTTITSLEAIHQIQKGQFGVTALGSPAMRMQQVWEAVPAA
jgi:hypothetical protein